MLRRLCAGVVALAAASAAVGAAGGCSSDEAPAGADASFDAVASQGPIDATSSLDADDATNAPALVRIAHLSADVGPLDVCYRTSPSDAFIGPLLVPAPAASPPDAGDASIDADGGPAIAADALRFPSASKYVSMPSGSVEIALVSAWQRSCAETRARARVTLDGGKRATIALMGVTEADAGPDRALDLVLFGDDATPAAASARVRLVHAALGASKGGTLAATGPLAAVAVEGTTDVPLADRIEPRHAATPSSTPPVVDALGYHTERALGPVALRLLRLGDAGAGAWTSSVASLDTVGGSVHTAFIVDDATRGLAVLWCDDLAAAAACTLVR